MRRGAKARQVRPIVASAWSSGIDAESVAERVADSVRARGVSGPSLALVVGTGWGPGDGERVVAIVRGALSPFTLVGALVPALIAGEGTLSEAMGVGVLAISHPDVRATSFSLEDLHEAGEDFPASVDRLGEAIGAGDDARATIVLGDSRGLAIQSLLPRLNAARGVGRRFAILGSVLTGDGPAAMLIDDRVLDRGLVGVTISGDIAVEAFTSQGATPMAPDMIVTASKGNLVRTISGVPALQMLRGLHAGDTQRGHVPGVMLGRLIDENLPTRGRGDYLMRTIVGFDEQSGSIAIDEALRVGQTVRFHRRDREIAAGDLEMLLDGQKLHGVPLGAIVVGGLGRGVPDGAVVSRAFARTAPGSIRARGGQEIAGQTPSIPLMGFGGAGEIGPIRGVSQMHRQSAVVALLRERGGAQ